MFQVINEHRKNTKLLQIIKINHEIITTKGVQTVNNSKKWHNNNQASLPAPPLYNPIAVAGFGIENHTTSGAPKP